MPWTTNEPLIDEIPGEEDRPKKSKAAPALDGAGPLLMVHLGDSSDQIWYATLESSSDQWGFDQPVGALRAEASPAVAGGLMLFPRVPVGGRLWQASFTSPAGWTFETENGQPTDANGNFFPAHLRPALAFSPNGRHLVAKSTTSTRIFHAFLPRRESFWQFVDSSIGGREGLYLTRTRPAIAVQDDTLHILHLGEDTNRIYHSRGTLSFDGQGRVGGVNWRESRVGGQLSKATPAVAVFDGRLHMVHLGDSSSAIWHSIYISEYNAWTQQSIYDQRSKAPPALAALGDRLHMVHLGESSNQIYWSTWQA
jgi:hypothetical protein